MIIFNTHEKKAIQLFKNGKYLSAITSYKKALNILPKNNVIEKARIFYGIGFNFQNSIDLDSTIANYNKANKLLQTLNNNDFLYLNYFYKASYYFVVKQLDSAYYFSKKTLKIAHKHNSIKEIISANSSIGSILFYEKDYNNASIYFDDALLLSNKIKEDEPILYINALNNKSMLLLNQKHNDSVLFYTKKSKLFSKKYHYLKGEFISIGLELSSYFQKKDIDKAFEIGLELLNITKQFEYSNNLKIQVNNVLKMADLSQKKNVSQNEINKEAIDLLNINKKISIKNKHTEIIPMQNEALLKELPNFYNSEQQLDNYIDKDAIINMLKTDAKINDSIHNAIIKRKLAEFETKYQTEKKEKQNAVLVKENVQKALDLKNEQTKKLIFVIVTLLLTLLLISYMFYENNRRKKAKRHNIHKQILIRAEERQAISKKLHDEVKNELDEIKKQVKLKSNNYNKIESV
jgi:hypothetical protein